LQSSDCLVFTLLAKKNQKNCFSESYFEVDLVNKLQGVIDKQRGQIKKLDQSILDFKAENEEVKLTLIVPIHQLKFDSNIDFKAENEEVNLTTGGHLIEFHLIESVDRIFRSNA
jgi:hypothetical protein